MKSTEVIELLNAQEVRELEKFAQVIPAELMQEIKASAQSKGVEVEVEILSRLLATIAEPQEFGFKSNLEKILKQGFSPDDAVDECKRNHQSWFYLYELEKLRLFLTFEGKIPRGYKEEFMAINVKEETKRILRELEAEAKAKKKK